MVLGKVPVPGRPTIWMIEGQGHIVLVVGAGGYLFSSLSPSLGDGLILTEMLSQRAVKTKTTNQPILFP